MMMTAKIVFDITGITGFGITLAFVGYVTVFMALVILYYIFDSIPRIISLNVRKKLRREGKNNGAFDNGIHLPGEENAAISLALFLFFNETHDKENTVLTIKNIRKEYSPWSSKIYNINQFQGRK